MIMCSDIRCMWNACRTFTGFKSRAVKEANSYERQRPGKADLGTVGFSVAEPISLCSLRAVGLWFSRIRGWSRAMRTHAHESRDVRRAKGFNPNAAAHQMGHQLGYNPIPMTSRLHTSRSEGPGVGSYTEQRHTPLDSEVKCEVGSA